MFPIGWDASDLQEGEEIYRSPWDCFGEFLKVPLKNSSGEWICRDAEKKQTLKQAYQALGMNSVAKRFRQKFEIGLPVYIFG